jgi:hypothetical protein
VFAKILAPAWLVAASAGCTIFDGLTPEPGDGGIRDAAKEAAATPCDDSGLCIPSNGICRPEPVCSSSTPCNDSVTSLADGAVSQQPITLPIDTPTCTPKGETVSDTVMKWTAPNGSARVACVYEPSGPKPLVLFFHPRGGSADDVYESTTLRQRATTQELGDGSGFALASDQGENLLSSNSSPSGPAHDFYYREFSNNPDFIAVDHLVDTLVAKGDVDVQRIYVMGWGDGAFFGQAYAILRNVLATPGGHRIAAAAVYEAGDPFQSPAPGEPDCRIAPYPTTHVPLYVLHRACSVVGCNAAEMQMFAAPPGYDVEDWITTLTSIDSVPPKDQILDAFGTRVSTCSSVCTLSIATEHSNESWPSGGTGSLGWEGAMLDFLAAHPLTDD